MASCTTPSRSKIPFVCVFNSILHCLHSSDFSSHPDSDLDEPIVDSLTGVFRDLLKSWREKVVNDQKSNPYISETIVQESVNVKTYILSENWPDFFNAVLFPAMRKTEEFLFDSYKTDIKEILMRHEKYCADQLQEKALTRKSVDVTLQSVSKARIEQIEEYKKLTADAFQKESSLRKSNVEQWNAVIDSFNHERGLWRSEQEAYDCLVSRWKIDPYENDVRMRRRLQLNKSFDDHYNASVKRDRGEMKKSRSLPLLTSPELNQARIRVPSEAKPSSPEKSQLGSVPRLEASLSVLSDKVKDKEEWNIVQLEEAEAQKNTYSAQAELIVLMRSVKGRFLVTKRLISFIPERQDTQKSNVESSMDFKHNEESFQWPLDQIAQIHLRRYKLRNSALEFFHCNGHNCLLSFPGENGHSGSKERIRLLKRIVAMKPRSLTFATTSTPLDIFTKSSLTQRWQRHEISNFEYIMALNTISGKTCV